MKTAIYNNGAVVVLSGNPDEIIETVGVPLVTNLNKAKFTFKGVELFISAVDYICMTGKNIQEIKIECQNLKHPNNDYGQPYD